jgi:hypothetical protein
MGSSFYVQLAPYLLLEYTYGGNDTTYLSSQVKLSRLENKYTGEMQFLNGSAAQNVTQNVLDFSAANIGGYKWAFLDKDVPVPYINMDSNLVYTDMSGIFTSTYVEYDRVRIHILSGYRLEDVQGLITQVYVKEAQTSKNSIFANNVYLNSDDRDILNPKPVLLGDRMYDRYIEFFIPSLKEVNKDFYANPVNPVAIGYQYSSNTRGFLFNSAIYVKVYEISTIEKKNGNLFFYTDDSYEVNVNQEDTYSLLTANIEEATDGDYFIYYPTYAGNFIEEFISELNAAGGNYAVINDIDVYEQVGLENFMTSSFSQVQLGEFDQPLEFRPLIRYADTAVSFSIDYTVRIFNRENGYQLIRKSSTTSFYPKKYGKNIEKIALAEQSYPFKVYNKVYGGSTVTFNTPEGSSGFNTVYIPVFYDSKNIVIQTKSVLAEGANPVNPNFGIDDIFLGQGDARIYLGDFDSYFKFSVFQVNSPPKKMDLSASVIQLAFKDSAGNMIKIPALDTTAENSSTDGELVFKVPAYVKDKVLGKTASVKNFYLVSTNPGASDTILYTGTVDNVNNVSKEQARLKTLASSVLSSSTSTTSTASSSTIRTVASTTETSKGDVVRPAGTKTPSILDTLTAANKEGVNSIRSTTQVQPVDIPGYTFDQNASSVKTGVKPVSQQSDTKAETEVANNLSQKPGTQTTLRGTE